MRRVRPTADRACLPTAAATPSLSHRVAATGDYPATVTDGYPKTIKGDYPETVTGGYPETVMGAYPKTDTGGYLETVTGGYLKTVTEGYPETVMGGYPETDSIFINGVSPGASSFFTFGDSCNAERAYGVITC